MRFSKLAEYFFQLEKVSSRNAMVEILAKLFKEADKKEISYICYLLQGRVAPLFEPIEFGMADKMVIRALAQAYNVGSDEVTTGFKREGDLGIVAQELKTKLFAEANFVSQNKSLKSKSLKVIEVYKTLYDLAITTGAGSVEKKINLLSALLQELDSLSVRYVVRIPLAKLRLGFSDMTILDGLSWMLSGSKKDRPEIEKGYNVRPDLGFIAKAIKEGQEGKGGIEGLEKIGPKIETPILMARAERLTSGEEIIEKIGECALEGKYDGLRLQVHFSKGLTGPVSQQPHAFPTRGPRVGLPVARHPSTNTFLVKLFSRNLEDVTSMYPDIIKGVLEQVKANEAIFEGEAIAFDPKTGRFLPFQETVQRKRKYDIEKKALEVPLKLMAFDLLYVNGENLIEKPYNERRKRLEEILK